MGGSEPREASFLPTLTLVENSGALSLSHSAETTQAGANLGVCLMTHAYMVRRIRIFHICSMGPVTEETQMTITVFLDGEGFSTLSKATARV